MAQASGLSVEGNSPRSTVIPSPERMTSGAPSMNGNTPEGGSTAAGGGGKLDPSREGSTGEGSNVNSDYNEQEGGMPQQKETTKEPESPSQSHTYAHLTPQPQVVPGYATYPSQVTPASPSPGANAVFTDAYGAAFLRPGSAGAFIPHTNPFGGHPSPLSPPRPTSNAAVANMSTAAGGVPPNSPLFPRLTGGQSNLHPNGFDRVMPQPPSPTLAYTTAGGAYQSYAGSAGHGSLHQSGSTEELTPGGWMDGG